MAFSKDGTHLTVEFSMGGISTYRLADVHNLQGANSLAPVSAWGIAVRNHAMCTYAGYTTLVAFRAFRETLGSLRNGAFRRLDGFPDLMELLGGSANHDIARRVTK
ncbi:MAG: hypothetical protein ACI8Y4_004702 [Candidatus Poriferisodalaceae bacterium]|jgi:hypothetical protein